MSSDTIHQRTPNHIKVFTGTIYFLCQIHASCNFDFGVGSGAEVEYKPLPSGPNGVPVKDLKSVTIEHEVTILFSTPVCCYELPDFPFIYNKCGFCK